MPLYEYKCNSCDKTFEMLQKISEEPMKDCLYCGGGVQKLISSSSFQFKGSGWYVTDYKKSSVDNSPPKNKEPKTNTGTNKNATNNK